MDGPLQNPLAGEAALTRAREDEELRVRTDLAIAKARKAEDWIDIYQAIVFQGVRHMAEQNHDDATEKLKEQKLPFSEVRRKFQYEGLPLTEEMQWEGPDYLVNADGVYYGLEWNRGQWIRVTWPDGRTVEFRGQEATVVATFLLWWQQFQKISIAQENQLNGKEAPRRLIEPGSPEWISYFSEKAKGQGTQS